MNRAIRMQLSRAARTRRSETKKLISEKQLRLFARLRKLRKKGGHA